MERAYKVYTVSASSSILKVIFKTDLSYLLSLVFVSLSLVFVHVLFSRFDLLFLLVLELMLSSRIYLLPYQECYLLGIVRCQFFYRQSCLWYQESDLHLAFILLNLFTTSTYSTSPTLLLLLLTYLFKPRSGFNSQSWTCLG